MSGGLAAKSLALPPPVLRRWAGCKEHERGHDQDTGVVGDHRSR
jgi:hypothetical protein